MRDTLRVGLLGCGTVSRFHASAIRDAQGVTLAGACSKHIEKAREFCAVNGGRVFDSYDEMLASDEIDSVSICTPNGCHAEQILKAIAAGKHVLVEKPMALTVKELDAVEAALKNSHVTLTSVCQHRFTDEAQAIKRAIENGDFGKIVVASLSMRFYRGDAYYAQAAWRGTVAVDGGGVLMNQGIHGVDLLCWLLGQPKEVCGYAKTLLRSIEVEDTAAGAVLFESGAVASIDATVCSEPSFSQKIFISGEKGSVLLDEDSIAMWALPVPCPVGFRGDDGFTSSSGPTAINYRYHTRQYEDFARAIATGTKPLIDAAQGRLPVEVILGLYRSSGEGRSVEIRGV